MNSLIQITVRFLCVVAAGIPLASASAQLAPESPQPIGTLSTPQGQIPVYAKGQLPILGYIKHTNLTPAQRAAVTARSEKLQVDTAQGETLLKAGNLDAAIQAFQYVLSYKPGDIIAYHDLASCYLQLGDTQKALEAERGAVYIKGGGDSVPVIRDTDTSNLLSFASLLDKTGQTAEATTVYNHAATLLKYMDNRPSSVYLLPLLGTEQGQIAYTPARLQALAQVGLGVFSQATQELTPAERVVHLREAARLYPNSPVVQSYLGDVLAGAGDAAGAKAARAQANSLGISRVRGLLDAQTAIMQEQKGVQ